MCRKLFSLYSSSINIGNLGKRKVSVNRIKNPVSDVVYLTVFYSLTESFKEHLHHGINSSTTFTHVKDKAIMTSQLIKDQSELMTVITKMREMKHLAKKFVL